MDWKFGARLSEHFPAPAQGRKGGYPGGRKSGLWENFFLWTIGWQVPAKEKAHGLASVSLVCTGVSSGVSRQSKLINLNHSQ
jgi:hypothetical protein